MVYLHLPERGSLHELLFTKRPERWSMTASSVSAMPMPAYHAADHLAAGCFWRLQWYLHLPRLQYVFTGTTPVAGVYMYFGKVYGEEQMEYFFFLPRFAKLATTFTSGNCCCCKIVRKKFFQIARLSAVVHLQK